MQADILKEAIQEDRESLLSMLNGDEEKLGDIMSLVKHEGITEKLYAQVFRLLFWKMVDPSDRVFYSSSEKCWYKGADSISDMELISIFSEAVYFVRKCVGLSWKSCQMYALCESWINNKEFAKTELAMDGMESFSKLKLCLRTAASIMPAEEPDTAQINWDAICDEEDSEEDQDIP